MEETSSINERIKKLVDYFSDGNNSKFASLVGSSEANIRNYIAGRQPKFDFLSSIVQNIEISYDWLLTGRGDMLAPKDKILPSSVVQSGSGLNASYQGTFNEPINTVLGSNNTLGEKVVKEKRTQKKIVSNENNNLQRTLYEIEKKLFKALQEIDYLKQANMILEKQLNQAVIDKDRAMTMLEKALSK